MKRKIKVTLLSLVVLIVVLFLFGRHQLFFIDWDLVKSYESPNGDFMVKHYRSKSEGGHAPYGDNFIIESWRSFPKAKVGETFFAGYCQPSTNLEWIGNEEIIITCKSTGDATRTQTSIVHGINVRVVSE